MKAPRWIPLPHHVAKVDEILSVMWSAYYGAALVGDDGEIACLPRPRCRLEVVATAATTHRQVNLVLPGQLIHHRRSLGVLNWFELPSGTSVGLWHLVGFKLRLPPDATPFIPDETVILRRLGDRILHPSLA